MDNRASTRRRSTRLKVGGLSAPISILIAYGVHQIWGKDMTTEVTIAVSSLVSSLVTVGSLCFWDIRALFLERFKHRRKRDGEPKDWERESEL